MTPKPQTTKEETVIQLPLTETQFLYICHAMSYALKASHYGPEHPSTALAKFGYEFAITLLPSEEYDLLQAKIKLLGRSVFL